MCGKALKLEVDDGADGLVDVFRLVSLAICEPCMEARRPKRRAKPAPEPEPQEEMNLPYSDP